MRIILNMKTIHFFTGKLVTVLKKKKKLLCSHLPWQPSVNLGMLVGVVYWMLIDINYPAIDIPQE